MLGSQQTKITVSDWLGENSKVGSESCVHSLNKHFRGGLPHPEDQAGQMAVQRGHSSGDNGQAAALTDRVSQDQGTGPGYGGDTIGSCLAPSAHHLVHHRF